jgi:hypothetical protein
MVPGALHYGQVANEHQIKLALNQCHQEDKKKDLCTQNMTNINLSTKPLPTNMKCGGKNESMYK